MGCKFPEHHPGASAGATTGSGSWWPLGVAVIVAALFAPVIGVFIHILSLVLTFTGMAAIAVGGGWVWWRVSHRQPRQLRMQYRPQMSQPRQRPGLPQDQAQELGQGGQQLNLHFHTAEAVEAFRRAVEGGQR